LRRGGWFGRNEKLKKPEGTSNKAFAQLHPRGRFLNIDPFSVIVGVAGRLKLFWPFTFKGCTGKTQLS